MIVEKVLGNISEIKTEKKIETVLFEWFEIEKKRIAKISSDGVDFGIAIDGNVEDGDILAETDNKIYIAKILPSRLIKIKVYSIIEMGRLCFELGNRHLTLRIEEDCVTVPYDEPTCLYLQKLGFDAADVTEVFSGFIECKAHGATHSHSHSHPHSHSHSHGKGHCHEH